MRHKKLIAVIAAGLLIGAATIADARHAAENHAREMRIERMELEAKEAEDHEGADDGSADGAHLHASAEVGGKRKGLIFVKAGGGGEGDEDGLGAVVVRG